MKLYILHWKKGFSSLYKRSGFSYKWKRSSSYQWIFEVRKGEISSIIGNDILKRALGLNQRGDEYRGSVVSSFISGQDKSHLSLFWFKPWHSWDLRSTLYLKTFVIMLIHLIQIPKTNPDQILNWADQILKNYWSLALCHWVPILAKEMAGPWNLKSVIND